MFNNEQHESAARHLAIRTMIALDLDPNDFRMRDKIITATVESLNKMLDDASTGCWEETTPLPLESADVD
jgi:hypothetical protein